MRKTWLSRKAERTTASSSRAEAASRPNGFSITTERVERAAARHARLAELRRDEREDGRRRREVVDDVALRAALAVGLRQPALQLGVGLGIVERAADVEDPARERLEDGVVDRLRARVGLERLAHLLAVPLVAAVVAARHADQRERRRQHVAQRQVVERRQQLAVREVARGAEDHERARARHARHAHAVAQRVRAHAFCTAWPPNCWRRAALTLARVRVVLARALAHHQRERDHGRGHGRPDRLLDRPAALARIVDVAADARQARIGVEREAEQLEQPGAHDRALLPELRDRRPRRGRTRSRA